jgi:zinc transport system substrate-binding protein
MQFISFRILRFLALVLLFSLAPVGYSTPAAAPSVVSTIQPLHALAESIASGLFEPELLLRQRQSPHDYRLTPAAARLLSTADLAVWIGPGLETQLAVPLQNLVPMERRLDLALQPALKLLPMRGGGPWEQDHDHKHEETHADADSHLWLDADNAIAIAEVLAARLSRLDPANAASYRQNAQQTITAIRAADVEARARLHAAQPKPYWVLHDSLQYFEKRYGLEGAGAIMVSPDRTPGARRVLQLRRQLQTQNIGCILYEERYGRRWIEMLIEDTVVKAIPIDPLGLEIEGGPDFYPKLLLNLAGQIAQCN